jgi:hypothetical protein
MAYEHREGSGSLFRNHKKEEGSKQPDYRGDAMIGGEVMEISAWVKEGNGGKFFSLNIKPKQTQEREEKPAPAKVASKFDVLADDIPF